MAILTLDGALAGFQPPRMFAKGVSGTMVAGRPHSFWGIAGSPGAGAFDTTLNGVTLSTSSAVPAGSLYRTDPLSGNSYLGRLQGMCTIPGVLQLCDRIWHNGGHVNGTTTAQTIVSPTWPARDSNGATTGQDVQLGLEVSVATTTGAAVITASYTNTTPTAGRTATQIDTYLVSSIAGSFYRLGLQAGDVGVKSVESVTLNVARGAGTTNLVAYRVLAALELTAANVPNAIDALTAGFPRLFNGTVPFFIFIPSTTTTSNISGTYAETQG